MHSLLSLVSNLVATPTLQYQDAHLRQERTTKIPRSNSTSNISPGKSTQTSYPFRMSRAPSLVPAYISSLPCHPSTAQTVRNQRSLLLVSLHRLHFDIPVCVGSNDVGTNNERNILSRRERVSVAVARRGRGIGMTSTTAAATALFFVDLALRWRAVTRVSCGRAVFHTGEQVAPISRTRLLKQTVDRLRLNIRTRVVSGRRRDG